MATKLFKTILMVMVINIYSFINAQVTLDPVNGYTDFFIPLSGGFNESGDKLVIGEKFGKIYLNDWGTGERTLLTDLEPIINKSGEQGLLDTELRHNRLYALYTALRSTIVGQNLNRSNINLIKFVNLALVTAVENNLPESNFNEASASLVRFVSWDLNENELSNFRILAEIPILSNNHVGGAIEFLSDETALISTGTCQSCPYTTQALIDGIISEAPANGYYKAQQTSFLQGKILRIDVETGLAPLDNPFYPSLVYMKGLRNPFRFTVFNDWLYIPDVGEARYESINVANAPGSNLGFPYYEGIEPYLSPNFLNPDTGTSFNNLITEATSFNDSGEWQVRKSSIAYGRFQNNYTRIVDSNYNERASSTIVSGISVVGGAIIPEINYYIFNDYFFPDIYFASINNNYLGDVDFKVNVGINSITKWFKHPNGDVYAISANTGLLKLNLESLSIADVSQNPEPIKIEYYNMLGQLVNYQDNTILIKVEYYNTHTITSKIYNIK